MFAISFSFMSIQCLSTGDHTPLIGGLSREREVISFIGSSVLLLTLLTIAVFPLPCPPTSAGVLSC